MATGDGAPDAGRSPGGGSCYWAKLGGDVENILENGGFTKNQTVQIDSPFFETAGCGKWTKIG